MDNRIQFPATKIDFSLVGTTGQDHDNYPLPSGQARYDHMRMVLIGLLSSQSSTSEPTEYRDGTFWFNLNDNSLKIRSGSEWVDVASVLNLDTATSPTTLQSWYESTQELLTSLAPEIVFSGQSTANNVTSITIPETLRSNLASDSRVFLYINGLLVKPTNCSLIGSPATTISLSGLSLSSGDSFTVTIRRVPSATYYTQTVVVP